MDGWERKERVETKTPTGFVRRARERKRNHLIIFHVSGNVESQLKKTFPWKYSFFLLYSFILHCKKFFPYDTREGRRFYLINPEHLFHSIWNVIFCCVCVCVRTWFFFPLSHCEFSKRGKKGFIIPFLMILVGCVHRNFVLFVSWLVWLARFFLLLFVVRTKE